MQAFIARHGQKTQAGSNKWQTVIYQRARQKSTQVNERGLQSANNIQRARQREIQNKQKVRNQSARHHKKTRLNTKTKQNTGRLGCS